MGESDADMYGKMIILLLTAVLTASCGESDEQKSAEICAGKFAREYFNFRYVDALKYTTADSRTELSFLSSNMTYRILDSLHFVTDTPRVKVESVDMLSDSQATARVSVKHAVLIDSIGRGPHISAKELVFSFPMLRERGVWKVRMEGLPRSEE